MNDDSTEKRMAGDYEVIQAVHIGDREVVLGENPQDDTGMKYMCAFCRQNALFAEYSEVMASDDFPEIVELFGQRVAEQAQKTHIELNKPRIQGIDDRPITAEAMAIPQLASFSASTSLTPSPVMATVWPCFWKARS